MLGGKHDGLPDLPLLQFAVTEQAVDALRFALLFECVGDAVGNGESLSERARRTIEAGCAVLVRVSLQNTAHSAQGGEFLHGEEALAREDAVKHGGDVSLREDEAVALLPIRLFRVDVHDAAEVESDHDLCGGERAARVSGARLVRHGHDVLANETTQIFQFLDLHSRSSFIM